MRHEVVARAVEGSTAMAASRDSEPVHKILVEKNVAMRTRDGVNLYADVYRPDASAKFPVLFSVLDARDARYAAKSRGQRNPNTDHDFGVDADVTARQTIFHGSRC